MAEASSHLESQPTSSTPDNTRNNDAEPAALQYWCYHCEKRVSIETLAADLPDIICFECKNGFVESVCPPPAAAAPTQSEPPPPLDNTNTSNNNEDPSFSNQFLQILRLIAEAARDDGDPPPPPPQPAVSDPGDFLRIELNGWNNDDEEDDDDGIDVDPSSDNEIANNNDDDDEEVVRQRRRELLRSRIRDFASRATRNRILDWSEILMGLEDHSMEFRVGGGGGGYVGNPEDYVDAAGYEALLQNLADADAGARRGPPPASKSAISNLNTLNITYQDESTVCAICKDSFSVPLTAKMLPCGHGYHEDCIVTWLGSRNTCPVCRFELPTDDPEYEQQRLKSTSSSNFTSSSNQKNRGECVEGAKSKSMRDLFYSSAGEEELCRKGQESYSYQVFVMEIPIEGRENHLLLCCK